MLCLSRARRLLSRGPGPNRSVRAGPYGGQTGRPAARVRQRALPETAAAHGPLSEAIQTFEAILADLLAILGGKAQTTQGLWASGDI